MIILNSCTRCGGDLHGRDDEYGPYFTCLQCGHTAEHPSPTSVRQQDEEVAV